MSLTRCEYSTSERAVSGGRETRGPEKGRGVWFLKGVKLVKLDWVTKNAVARHMTRGATDAESSVKNRLKQRPMSRNLEL